MKLYAIFVIILVAHQTTASTINLGNLMGDVSQVAVAGEKVINKMENSILPHKEIQQPSTTNILSDMANTLGDLANIITSLKMVDPFSEPTTFNLLRGMATGLADLANAITSLQNERELIAVESNNNSNGDILNDSELMPEVYGVASDGASIIGELNGASAQIIASAAKSAAPYLKKMNEALGDLANIITGL